MRPQLKAGRFEIDLVVEGAVDRRLAIECDGDEAHEPNHWTTDVAKQHALEHAGWIFWRCFAASFILRREHVLEDLFGTLEQIGIDPLGAAPVEPERLSTHSVVGRPRPAAPSAAPAAPAATPVEAVAAAAAPVRAARRSRPPR